MINIPQGYLDTKNERIVIDGPTKLEGSVHIRGSKNAALPIMAATVLSDEVINISNLPYLSDIATMSSLLCSMGAKVKIIGHGNLENNCARSFDIDCSTISNQEADYEIVKKMRASIVILGPLLAKFGKAKIALPGGCAIGARPIDLHLKAMEALGAEISLEDDSVIANAPNGLIGAEINFPIISVGATENAIMAATLAKGVTTINNAAIEPEITDLISFLLVLGADIKLDEDNRKITINGVKN